MFVDLRDGWNTAEYILRIANAMKVRIAHFLVFEDGWILGQGIYPFLKDRKFAS